MLLARQTRRHPCHLTLATPRTVHWFGPSSVPSRATRRRNFHLDPDSRKHHHPRIVNSVVFTTSPFRRAHCKAQSDRFHFGQRPSSCAAHLPNRFIRRPRTTPTVGNREQIDSPRASTTNPQRGSEVRSSVPPTFRTAVTNYCAQALRLFPFVDLTGGHDGVA